MLRFQIDVPAERSIAPGDVIWLRVVKHLAPATVIEVEFLDEAAKRVTLGLDAEIIDPTSTRPGPDGVTRFAAVARVSRPTASST